MDKYAAGTKASELRLVEKTPSPADQPVDGEVPSDRIGNDTSLAQATREFESGRVDQPIWTRALLQAGGDEKLATPVYLRARATALRVAKRDDRKGKSPHPGPTHADAQKHVAAPKPTTSRKHTMWAAGALACIIILGASIMMWPAGSGTRPGAGATQARPPTVSAAAIPNKAEPPGSNADTASGADVSNEKFANRLETLKGAENWNVLVIHAAEWTRKDPGNPVAWRELGAGYLKLRQFDDALAAATKAVEIAPEDFLAWRNLGQVYLALNDLGAALVAFDRATALNNQDVASLVQAGTLNVRFGHIPAARTAFAKALAVQPDDVDALCGAASVARQDARIKDAEAMILQVKASGGRCPNVIIGESVSVAAPAPAGNKAVVIPRR